MKVIAYLGAIIAWLGILGAWITAECIPLMFVCVVIAGIGTIMCVVADQRIEEQKRKENQHRRAA